MRRLVRTLLTLAFRTVGCDISYRIQSGIVDPEPIDPAAMKTTLGDGAGSEKDTLRVLRLFLLALVLLGTLGFLAELFLLDHTESASQLIPFGVLAGGLISLIAVALRPTRRTVRFFQAMMALFIASGVIGLYLHYTGNSAFEREMDPSAAGVGLVWQSLRGATPALAPGGFVHLGLIGLMYAFRHPALDAGSIHRKQEAP